MSGFFGDLERIAADLYPYRWAIAAGVLVGAGRPSRHSRTAMAGMRPCGDEGVWQSS